MDLLASGLSGGSGSTVGPDGALYVAEPVAGEVSRIDPRTGAVSTFASGLPTQVSGTPGGVMDVAFLGRTAYVLVTLVGADVGGTGVVGVYRLDGATGSTVVADIGTFAVANPPGTDFFVPSGVQYAMEPYRGGFLVTDGHHNRVYRVSLDGDVSVLVAFGNIVPTGLAVAGPVVFMAEAGPVPHLPQDGRIVAFTRWSTEAHDVVSGGPLLVDVELGRGHALYGLAQGIWPVGNPEGSPATEGTGQLLKAGWHGSFDVVADGLDRPTSFELIRGTAYVVTLDGEVWTVDLDQRRGRH